MEKYFSFSGESTRSEYWAINLIGGVVAGVLAGLGVILMGIGADSSNLLLALGAVILAVDLIAVFWLSVATAVRRCNDAGINGWWAAASCVPYIGWAVFLVLGFLKTDAK